MEHPPVLQSIGLIDLASRCLHLSKLRSHFYALSLVGVAANVVTTLLPIGESFAPRGYFALTDLDVGDILFPLWSAARIAQTILRIFPRILNVEYTDRDWERVNEHIRNFRRTSALVRRADSVTSDHPDGRTCRIKD
jgi:hypothetical protein